MLNIKMELEKFRPVQLELLEKKSGKLPDNIRESIQLFNKSLKDVKFGNEDMAIIALKKAISINPSFYEAMNLLGICYLIADDVEMARESFAQVIEADDSSIKAMEFIKKLDGVEDTNELGSNIHLKKSNKTGSRKKVKSEQIRKAPKTPERKGLFAAWLAKGLQSENNNIYGLKYIVGILIGALMVGFIWYMVPTDKSLFTFERVENIIKDPELEEEIKKLNERIAKLEDDITARKEENLELMDSFQTYKDWIGRLDEAQNEYLAGNYIQSADILTNTQGMKIPDELNDKYRELWDKVRLKAAEKLYQEGTNIYNGNRNRSAEVYKQALTKFESAITFLEDDKVSYLPALYYQAGKAAARSDELERAVELFETIIRDFPGNSYSSYAASRLREIESGREISGN
ncbi:MAG: tetratricopeptide repeat protein [Clostridiaceae bacterium]|jgi:tetratricopeptide (TPR) repeat protein|nr:tetratricopeptide repeat protein [Clostridiaceae bacterium]